MQDADSYGIIRVSPFDVRLNNFGAHKFRGAIDLQNRRLQVFFNNDIFGAELARLGTEDSYYTFETANHYFVLWRVTVVNVTDAD